MNPFDQFEEIARLFYEPLFRFAMSLTRAEADAQDLTQQTFYIWATKGHQLRDGSKVKTWLFTTLHRAFLEWRRKRARFVEEELDEVVDEPAEVSPTHSSGLEASEVLAALRKVDEVYQAAVALFYLQSCSYADISAILNIPIGTVKSRIARGIAQLRKILSREPVVRAAPSVPAWGEGESRGRRLAPQLGQPATGGTRLSESDTGDQGEWDLSSSLRWERFGACSLQHVSL
jgi:RNA polymerase sigma-70 factor (ECF subfamily)